MSNSNVFYCFNLPFQVVRNIITIFPKQRSTQNEE